MSALETIVTPLGWLLRGKRAGDKYSVRTAPQLATTGTIELTTPAFPPGGPIPLKHAGEGRGANLSPELHWGPLPAGTAQLLLIMEDIDVPLSKPVLHLVALFAPELPGLPEGSLTTADSAIRWVPAFRGRTGYAGPRALPGHGTHKYGFHLYALDQAIPADRPLASLDDLLPLVAGHILAAGLAEGTQKG